MNFDFLWICGSISLTNGDDEEEAQNPQELSFKQLNEIINEGQKFIEFVKDIDPQIQRKSKFTVGIEQLLKPYQDEAREKSEKVIRQKKISEFFKKPWKLTCFNH